AEAAARSLRGLRHLQRTSDRRGLSPGPVVTRSDGSPPGPSSGGTTSRSHEASATRIAVDLLGGEEAPPGGVGGALQALDADPTLQLLLVGPRSAADEVLSRVPGDRVTMHVADRGVAMGDPVTRGVDAGTSIGAAVRQLADGRAQAVVSAGSSGATV